MKDSHSRFTKSLNKRATQIAIVFAENCCWTAKTKNKNKTKQNSKNKKQHFCFANKTREKIKTQKEFNLLQ